MPDNFRIVPPRASAMIESLRGLGYSTETAIADLVDNSISAAATEISIQFDWSGMSSTVALLDDGFGMTDKQLEMALTLGSRNPSETRGNTDLGRFGFGLKTASFSQGRCLTVASKTETSSLACLRWDLEKLDEDGLDSWRIFEGPRVGSESHIQALQGMRRGTLVLWESLDKLVTPKFSEQDFLDLIDRVERHLSAVFTLYLSASSRKLSISINGRQIEAWDPFMEGNSGTWCSPIEKLRTDSGPVSFQGFVLPHRDMLKPREIDAGAGERGWTGQQGFYVFRNRRLLVAGSWLGLGENRPWTKEEPFRLARIKLEITNLSDMDWKIDIRKSTARVPAEVRERLTVLAQDVRNRARKVFAFRGGSLVNPATVESLPAWIAFQGRNGMKYKINRENPAIGAALETFSTNRALIEGVLTLIEETVPVQKIWLDTAEAKDTPREDSSDSMKFKVKAMLKVFFTDFVERRGLSAAEAKKRLGKTEPFSKFPAEIEAVDKD